MINQVYLQVELPALVTTFLTPPAAVDTSDYQQLSYTNSIGHALIQTVQVEIGGQPIDKQFGTWLEIWDELTQTAEKETGYNDTLEPKSSISYICGPYISKMFAIPPLTLCC